MFQITDSRHQIRSNVRLHDFYNPSDSALPVDNDYPHEMFHALLELER